MSDNSEIPKSFLSHNSRDKPAVEVIQGLLVRGDPQRGERPIPCWFDKDDLRSRGTWMSQLEDAVATCGSAVVFYGPDGRGPVHKYEVELLLKRAMYEQGRDALRLVLVLLPGAQESAIQGFISLHMWADFRKGLDDAAALQRLRAFILGEAPKSGPGDDPKVPKPEIEPYRGLEPFEGKHANYFFGRNNEIRELCGRLREWPFTAVIGGSGSGKSSIVRAGLQTELATQEHPALAHITTITVRPGSSPLRALADQVAASPPEPSATITERLMLVEDFDKQFRTGSDKLLNVLSSLYPRDDQHVLLVIDQFEELFTHNSDNRPSEPSSPGSHASDSQQTQFVELLATVAKSQLDRLRIVITLRADFFDRCLSVPTLKSLIENRTLLLGKLSDDALRTVIEKPAFEVRAYFEKGLVARILKDVENQNGSLPLLQHALKELWEQRRFGFLTDDAYDETGGVEGALKKRANATLQNLSEDQREIAKNVFLRLTTLGEGVSDTRRRVRKRELYPEKTDPNAIDSVLKELSSQTNRLIVTNDDGTVEVTHEALIQRWDTLKGWLAENRDDKRLHDRLRDAANEWAAPQHGRDQSYLWEGGRLELAENFDKAHSNMLTNLEREFLVASIGRREHLKTLKRRLVSVGAVITVVAVVAALIAALQTQKAQHQQAAANRENADFYWRLAVIARDAERPESLKASQLFLRSADSLCKIPSSQKTDADQNLAKSSCHASSAIDHILIQSWVDVHQCEISEDASRLLTWKLDGNARLWDLTSPGIKLLHSFAFEPGSSMSGAKFNRDASSVLIWSVRKAELWDVKKFKLRQIFPHSDYVEGAQFSRDNSKVLTWNGGKTAQIWDVTDSKPSHTFEHEEGVSGAKFSQDESKVLTWSLDHTAKVWDATKPEKPLMTLAHRGPVQGALFNQNEDRVLTWSWDYTAKLWNVTGSEPILLQTFKHNCDVYGAQFNRDETRVLTWADKFAGSDKGEARLWDVNSNTALHTLKHPHIRGATFNGDGSRILTWGGIKGSGEANLWNIDSPEPEQTYKHRGAVIGATFIQDQSGVLTWGWDGSAISWSVLHSDALRAFQHADWVKGARSIWNDSRVLTWSGDGTARLWDAMRPDAPVELKHDVYVSGVKFRKRGSPVLTWSADTTAKLWDPTKPVPLQTFPHNGYVHGALFSQDESRVLTWSSDESIHLWDVSTSKPLQRFESEGGGLVLGAQLSQDGSRALTWSEGGSPRLWEEDKPKSIRAFALRTGWSVGGAEFNRDATKVLIWSLGKACLYDCGSSEPLKTYPHNGYVKGAKFSRDESKVLTWDTQEAVLWDVTRPIPLQIFKHQGEVDGAVFSGDESKVLTWSAGYLEAKFWDVKQPEPLQTFVHNGIVNGAEFTRDDSKVLSWSGDGKASIWDVGSPIPLQTFQHQLSVKGAEFTLDESRLLTWSGDNTVRLWDVSKPDSLQTFKYYADMSIIGSHFSIDDQRILAIFGKDAETVSGRVVSPPVVVWNWDIMDPLVKLEQAERLLELEVRSGTTLDLSQNLRTFTFSEWMTKANSAQYLSIEKRLPARLAKLARPDQATNRQPTVKTPGT